MHIFLIGPASVGKSTVGKLLAESLNQEFVDIDREFCSRIEPIDRYIDMYGYLAYCEENSSLVDNLIVERSQSTVFACPSGFLVHENAQHLINKHLELLGSHISILLLPSENPESVADLIARRQVERWGIGIDFERQKKRFLERFEKYKNYGDIKIFSMESPRIIVNKILVQLGELSQ